MSLCAHARDTRASLAGTIPNVTILWGSWHWAVSGPIGPNLPVFHYPESRSNPVLPSRKPKGGCRREGPDSLSLSSRLTGSANGERERENPSVSSLVLPIEARKEHARDNIKRCANENAKTGIFGPDFPSDARHLGPVWPPVWINVISRSRFFRLPSFLFIYLFISLALFHSFFFYRSLSPPLSFPYLLVLSR